MSPLIAAIALAAVSHRNPFQYVTRPAPAVAPKAVKKEPAVIEPMQTPVVVEPQVQQRPDPPRFPYRFIGMFGYTDDPIVAFAAEDRIVTVQAGAAIDGQFVVRNIGLESVEIGFLNDERTVRIRLGESH